MKLIKAIPVILSVIALIYSIYANIKVQANYNALVFKAGTTVYTVNCGQTDQEVSKVKRESKDTGNVRTTKYTLFSKDGSKVGSVALIYKEDDSGNIYSVETTCNK